MRTLIATLHEEFHVHLGDRDEHWKSIVMVTIPSMYWEKMQNNF